MPSPAIKGLVGIQSPPPLMLEVPPHFAVLSIIRVRRPASAAVIAADSPAAPEPTTRTSTSLSQPPMRHLRYNRTMLSGCTLDRVTASRKPNRGPKAAAGNRQALVAAALEVFAE